MKLSYKIGKHDNVVPIIEQVITDDEGNVIETRSVSFDSLAVHDEKLLQDYVDESLARIKDLVKAVGAAKATTDDRLNKLRDLQTVTSNLASYYAYEQIREREAEVVEEPVEPEAPADPPNLVTSANPVDDDAKA